MARLENIRPQCSLLTLAAFWLLSALPLLSAENPKDLMTAACSNEIIQGKGNVLWASEVERRIAGHVYREQEIETLDGPIHRLLSVDNHQPSPSELRQDNDRLRELNQNPKTQLALKKNREAQEKKVDDLLRVIPNIFLFQDQGKEGNLEKLAFFPNRAYKPATHEETALHALSGEVLIDLREKRIARFSGTLTQQVDVGLGILGHLNKGGVVEVNRVRISPGQWGTSLFRIDLDGRVAVFKSISEQLDEIRSNFQPVPSDTNIQKALERIADKSPIFSQRRVSTERK